MNVKDTYHPESFEFTHFRKLIKGIGLSLLAWLIFTIMAALSQYLQKEAVSLITILFFQNVIGMLVITPFFLKGRSLYLKKVPWKLVLIRSTFGQLNIFLLFLAVKTASLSESMLLSNTAPIFIPIIAFFWLKNKIQAKIWPGIILGFLGIFLILHPEGSNLNVGEIYALLSGVCLSIILISVRLLSLIINVTTILFYFFLSGLIVFTPLAIIFWQPLSLPILGLIITVAILFLTGQFLLTKAFVYGESSQLSPFCYSVVVYATFLDWYIWKITPTALAFIGILLVSIGGIMTIIFTKPKRLKNQ